MLGAKCGAAGAVLKRTVVLDPGYPVPEEKHGFLLWADEEEGKAVAKKLHEVEPFKRPYRTLQGSWEQGAGEKLHNVRGIWRQGPTPWARRSTTPRWWRPPCSARPGSCEWPASSP
jgi:hypothetical protein